MKVLFIFNSNFILFVSMEGKIFGYIMVGYRGIFVFGCDGLVDVKFCKMSCIIICGKVFICCEVFKDILNESCDFDWGELDRYIVCFFLKYNFLE